MTAIPQTSKTAATKLAAKPRALDTPPKEGRGHASKRVRNEHRKARKNGRTTLALRPYVAKRMKERGEVPYDVAIEAIAWLDAKA